MSDHKVENLTAPILPATPPAEVEIDETLIRRLLAEQHPDLASATIQPVDHGWDNAMFRLGDDLAVRIPRRALAADLARNEQRHLPRIADQLPLPIPTPLRRGEPGCGFPWHWSIVPWFDGETADTHPPQSSEAPALAAFLVALHTPAPDDAPENPYRGIPLSEREVFIADRLTRLRANTDAVTLAVETIWREALAAPNAKASVWLHGDLHPRNILTQEHKFKAIIDWGDMTSGDATCDLAAIWMLFDDSDDRQLAFDLYMANQTHSRDDAAMRIRAMGSAVGFAAALLDTGLTDDPRHAAIGRATFRRLSEDAL